jgi:lytic murein transglycosylase
MRFVALGVALAGALGLSGPVAVNAGTFDLTPRGAERPAPKPVTKAKPRVKPPAAEPVIEPESAPSETQPKAAPVPQVVAAPSQTVKKTTGSRHHEYAPPKSKNCKNTGRFSTWLKTFRKEAAAKGISKRTISTVLDGMTLNRRVLARDRRQGFFAQSFLSFQAKLATKHRLYSSRRQIKKNKRYFQRVEKQYGVPASVITGFWALESDFGAGMGKDPILGALATLAYDCRRSDMFRAELLAALQIIDRGDMRPSQMIGSWAGEIGQTQFLPTRYLEYAIDYDGNGSINLFSSEADVIGSTANYMQQLGWKRGQPWIEEVQVPVKMPWQEADVTIKHPRRQWVEWGVKRRDGSALPSDGMPASLILPMGRFGPAFIAYENFDIYLKWNQSLNYATTAAYLATRIDGAPVMRRGRSDINVLSQDDTKALQRLLKKRGFDVGEVDGIVGAKTRDAIRSMQVKFGLPADSFPTRQLISRLRRG